MFSVGGIVPGTTCKVIQETEHYVAVEFPEGGSRSVSRIMSLFEQLRAAGLRPVQGSLNMIVCEKGTAW